MPTYEYRCKDCSHDFEAQQSFSDDALETCPKCGGTLKKVYGNVGISFKGSGFYKNDARSGSKTSSSNSSKTSSTTGDSSTTASSDSSSGGSSGSEKTPAATTKSSDTKSASTKSSAAKSAD